VIKQFTKNGFTSSIDHVLQYAHALPRFAVTLHSKTAAIQMIAAQIILHCF